MGLIWKWCELIEYRVDSRGATPKPKTVGTMREMEIKRDYLQRVQWLDMMPLIRFKEALKGFKSVLVQTGERIVAGF